MIVLLVIQLITLARSQIICESAYCNVCTTDGKTCKVCKDNYILMDGKCVFKAMRNCQTVTAGMCVACKQGFAMSALNTCTAITTGAKLDSCSLYEPISSELICKTCELGYINSNGKCSYCKANPYCKTFAGDCEHCTQCHDFFGLVKDTCAQPVDNCIKYSGALCTKCLEGFYLSHEGSCVKGPVRNCTTYTYDAKEETYTCTKCFDGYIFDTSHTKCVKESNYLTPGCKKMASTTACQTCKDGYFLANGACKDCADNCEKCQSPTVCTKCRLGYFVNGYGQCSKSTYGKFGCNDKAIDQASCLAVNKFCVFESTGFGTHCTYKGLNCTAWNVEGECIACKYGYKRNENAKQGCSPELFGCKSHRLNAEGKFICTECEVGFFLNEDYTCSPCGNQCTVGYGCTHSAGMCNAYTCNDYGCIACANSIDICNKCKGNNTLANNTCGPDICVENLYGGKCNKCAYYTLNTKFDYTTDKYIPETYYYYAPDHLGNCRGGTYVDEEEYEDEEEEDYTAVIIGSILGGVLVIAIIVIVIIIIIILIVKFKPDVFNKCKKSKSSRSRGKESSHLTGSSGKPKQFKGKKYQKL